MPNDPQAAVRAVLQPGEQILWTGTPDREVMLKTLGKRSRSRLAPLLLIGIVGAIVFTQRDQLSFGGMIGSNTLLPIAAFVGAVALILFLRRSQATSHIDNLAYGITDRRLLILHKGRIIDERPPAALKWVELRDRIGADGFSDIIWETRLVRTGTDTQSTPIDRERARVGFKALPDGPLVLERIEAWRREHESRAGKAARATVAAMDHDSDLPRLVHPRLRMSIATPPGWSVSVRKKTFPFGKTRMDLHEQKWQDPSLNEDWNVIRLQDDANAEVNVEAVQSEPVARFEDMANPNVPEFIKKVMKVVDTEASVSVGGIPGFRVDQELSGKGDTQIAIGASSDKVQSIVRRYVLHDGRFQYCITSSWPKGKADQAAACEAIVQSFRGCSKTIT